MYSRSETPTKFFTKKLKPFHAIEQDGISKNC